ncbi:helicase-exonuclease AddAB subunit AddB [Paenibacillus sp. 7124]|uniref:ATP-dependent helicase/deoxyribonuclease subunit B n=1 Tax=Paenibacillus apii TaxID=1850370 RepID=A0A6M1PHN4_9BACL|nr:helicase-exonuclease AddAB subunit AddB [Paenibacillus apii]NGM81825.1 helicase-exonuclease AddAB subunit AddB [Paenibacillus apii]NJJ41016.1 helicase-exonuclease AddAB subunit AddB [Paenibacillus apii]
MSVTFLIGRSGSGKTTKIWNAICSALREDPLGPPIIQLVPEQGSFSAEQGLLSACDIRGSLRAQTLSFPRLSYRVKQETGGRGGVPIGDEGKKMLLYKILSRRKEELKLFGASSDRPGFVDRLSRLHAELKRCCLGAPDLEEQISRLTESAGGSPILAGKLADLKLVFGDLEKEMSRLYMDEEDRLAELAELIPSSSFVKGSTIFVDGFRGFTAREFTVLRQLMLHAADITVALTLDRPFFGVNRPHELDLFHPSASAYIKLRGMAEELGAEVWDEMLSPSVLPRFAEAPALAHLERGFDRRLAYRGPEPAEEEITIRAAVNKRAEIEGALREMMMLAREQGAKYGEMAVFVRKLEDYDYLVPALFRDYGVPFFLDRKEGELHHPLVEFIRSALDIVRRRWRYEDVFRCIKTGFLLPADGSLTRDDMDTLENYVLACGIQGYRWTDKNYKWKAIPSLSLEGGGKTDNRLVRLMEACREAVTGPLKAFERRIKRSRSAGDLCRAVFELLEDTSAPRELEYMSAAALEEGRTQDAREHRQLWGAILDLLDQIVEMMGDEALSFDMFAGILETGLAELRMGLVPPSLDQVLVGTMDRTRTTGVKYAFLLGFNEGVVPALIQEDGVLSETERSFLEGAGMELAPGASRKMLDERFLIYNALTSASRKLWISYACTDDEGKSLLPSEVIRHLRRMYPEVAEHPLHSLPVSAPPEEHRDFIGNPEQSLRMLIVQLRQWKQGQNIPAVWWEVYNWFADNAEWRPHLQMLTGSLFYRNFGAPLRRETSLRLYGGSTLRGSVSRMEKFVSCPFSHFASYGLRLKERQLYKLQAPDIGQLFHAALSTMAAKLRDEGRSWGAMTPDECRMEAGKTVDMLSPMLQGEILLSSKRYGYISRKLKNIVGRASVILGEHARRGSFDIAFLELDFGPGKPLPPLRIELPNGCLMEVVGRIDRVDTAEGENGILLRVIDYKSSRKDLKLHEVYYGLSLQMLTYLDVLLAYAEEWLGAPAFAAGTLYFHVHDPLLSSANGMNREQAQQELLKRFKMKGLLMADREVVSLMDTSLDKGHSSIVPVAIKSDGSFYSSASVATPEQWGRLLSSVRGTITEIGTRITEGDVAITPYRIQQETACTFCSYRAVCQFDEAVEGNGFKHLGKPGKEAIWEMLSRQDEGGNRP